MSGDDKLRRRRTDAGDEPRSFAPTRRGEPGADEMTAAVDDDAHLGTDGHKLRDPMSARRHVPSSGATGGLNGGSGAD
jgi:hypothetical protein